MANSTKRSRSRRRKTKNVPPKPYKDFPLTPHPLGYWCKSINSKVHYFGRWGRRKDGEMVRIEGDGWKEALEQYEQQRNDLHAGRKPRESTDGLTITDLCNRYLTAKQELLDTGEITPRTFRGYKMITDRLVSAFGSRLIDDISMSDLGNLRALMAKTLGPVALGNQIQGVRSVFKFAWDEQLISQPVRYGQRFKKPSKKTLRKNRAEKGKRMFEPAQIRTIIEAAPAQLRAMFLLAINCGFGNTDVSSLTRSAVDFEGGWIEFPRPKTGIERRCPLWNETITALCDVSEMRPKPKDEADVDLVFVTKYGSPWVKTTTGSSDDAVAKQTAKLLKELHLHRPGLGFYAVRHTFQTIGEEAGETATKMIMGHSDDSMSAAYRERISDERLKAVTDHVRTWLFGEDVPYDDASASDQVETERHQLRIVG